MRFRAANARGIHVSRNIFIIWYETSAAFRPVGNADGYCPTDLLAFILIIYMALKSNAYEFKIPSLFRTIAQDATFYFLMIFTSHLALELALIFGKVRIFSYFLLLAR